jgi:hypothetical protein
MDKYNLVIVCAEVVLILGGIREFVSIHRGAVGCPISGVVATLSREDVLGSCRNYSRVVWHFVLERAPATAPFRSTLPLAIATYFNQITTYIHSLEAFH